MSGFSTFAVLPFEYKINTTNSSHTMKFIKFLSLSVLSISLFIPCEKPQEKVSDDEEFKVDFETYTLDNGLQLIFHVDHSDSVVAVALTSPVGSAREHGARAGCAYLFEHLWFIESEALAKGG